MKISYFSVGLLALFSPLASAWSKEGTVYHISVSVCDALSNLVLCF